MATYLYDDGELVEYTLGDDLNSQVRSLFLISDEETIYEVTIDFTDDEIVDLTLPLIASLNGKHYYSLPRKLFNFIELTGSQEPTGGGHVFSSKADLQTAVDDWNTDSISATETYGHIRTWNVSAITDMSLLFNMKTNITTLDLSGWDTSNVTNMRSMFANCISLTSLDVSNFDTSNVVNMSGMFNSCYKLASLDLSSFDTSSVSGYGSIPGLVGMSHMFYRCVSLTSLDVSSFDTTNVESMSYMFGDAESLTTLNLNNWNTSSLQNMIGMFAGCTDLISVSMQQTNSDNGVWNNLPDTFLNLFLNCENLTTISGIENWDTSSVTNMFYVFDGCKKLTTLNISNWNVESVEDFSRMFARCTKLSNLNLSNWSTSSNVESIFGMFYECEALTSLNLSGFDTSGVSRNDMAHVFNGCTSLSTVTGLSSWCVENISQAYPPMHFATDAPFANDPDNLPVWGTCPTPYTFSTKAELQTAVNAWNDDSTSAMETYGNINNWNVSAITNMGMMFNNKTNITSLDLSGWDTSNVTIMSGMFQGCSSLTSLDVSNFDTSNVEYMNGMFYECNNLTSLDLSNFDTSSVTNMASMFSYCSSLTSITFGENFSGSDMNYMFLNCSALTSLDLSSFDTSSVTGMTGMFRNCSALTSLTFGDNFDTGNVTNMSFMFTTCSALTSLDISGWCVTQIDYVPFRFAENAPFADDPNNLPVWGTCP